MNPMRELLGRMNITGLDTDAYINNHQNNVSALPNIGIGLSGGGYRAMLNGAGVVQAFDNRTPNSTAAGQLGGLLQASTYLAGLSGGSWMVSSLYANNFTSVSNILGDNIDGSDLWQLGNTIFAGPSSGSVQLFDSVGYYASLLSAVNDKNDAGFNTTITDYWGRALSYQLVNASEGGPAYTFSSIATQEWFNHGDAPMPLVVADGRAPGEVLIPGNTTVYTFDPWEMGTFDPTVAGFVPLEYLGTNFSSGRVRNQNRCVTGFDNIGYVFGTSSTLFNQILITVNGTNTTGLLSSALQDGIEAVLGRIGAADDDIADYPNPFFGWNNNTNPNHASVQLTLVDGGEDNENIPLNPLIQPLRAVDVIFAVDTSADTNATLPTAHSATGWPDGASLVNTYQRSFTAIQNGTAFPSIPDTNTFFNLGLNNRPTFFGCDASNITNGPAPLIVYLPNAPYVYNSNTSTYQMEYNNTERNAVVLNGYNLATQGNGTLDAEWPACVGCAILSRSLDRTGTDVPEICTRCFSRYCWDGTVNSTQPGNYIPEAKLMEVKVTSGAARNAGVVGAVVVAMVVGVWSEL
jgi:lysophospholipase